MSEYPDDVKLSKRQPQLPDPKPGHEWVLHNTGTDYVTYWQRPIRNLYDWSKTAHTVLVVGDAGIRMFKGSAFSGTRLAAGIWQAHIGGDPCPVDPDATVVELRGIPDRLPNYQGKAGGTNWAVDRLYRVTGLAESYNYE